MTAAVAEHPRGPRREGRERDRNLLNEAASFVERFSPELILSENVAGIKDLRYGGIWDTFRKRLEKLGYVTGSKVVCTSKFGVFYPTDRIEPVARMIGNAVPPRLAQYFASYLVNSLDR